MTIQQAIEKAVYGGYFPSYIRKVGKEKTEDILRNIRLADTFLDPLFWQSLGKAMGWGTARLVEPDILWLTDKEIRPDFLPEIVLDEREEWKEQWHRLIDHLAEGKNAESFF
jgi:hypothetical protein